MRRRIEFFSVLLLLVWLAGCATGRNYQADIDALNAKLAALQGELSAKDDELSKLRGQVQDNEDARLRAEGERRDLSRRLEEALAQLEAEAARSTKPSPSKPAIPDSDLK